MCSPGHSLSHATSRRLWIRLLGNPDAARRVPLYVSRDVFPSAVCNINSQAEPTPSGVCELRRDDDFRDARGTKV